MPRIQTLFASAAVGVLLLGLLISRLKMEHGMTVVLRRTGYGLPDSLLCYGVALFFCLFAVLYSAAMLPWSVQAANWHFGLSVLLAGLFCAASFAADRFKLLEGSSGWEVPVLAAFSFSPACFCWSRGRSFWTRSVASGRSFEQRDNSREVWLSARASERASRLPKSLEAMRRSLMTALAC